MIASDLDGTLLDTNHLLTDRTIAAVQAAHAAGIRVVAATGRSTTSAVPRVSPAEVIDTAVCSNGSLIYDLDSDQITDRFPIAPEMVDQLFVTLTDIDDRFSFCWETDRGNGWDHGFNDTAFLHSDLGAKRGIDHRPRPTDQTTKIMVRHPEISHEDLREYLVTRMVDPVTVSTSGVEFVEITGEGVNKSTALDRLCNRWGIDPAHVVAFGDNYNDSAMLSWAGHGVAMGNASDAALDAANEVIGINADDAVAAWIENALANGMTAAH